MAVCFIAGAGDCEKINITKNEGDIVIAADGGVRHLENSGITPDYIIGDFDSLGAFPEGENVVRLKPEKDITDMHAAVDIGIEKGCTEFVIFGATGGRLAHTIANIQLAASLAQRGFDVTIKADKTEIRAICNSSVSFGADYTGYISVFAHSDNCTGVTIRGLKYELENAQIKNSFALGVSNEFCGKESFVEVKNGTLVIVYNALNC